MTRSLASFLLWLFGARDHVRPVEFTAALILAGFAVTLVKAPEMMAREPFRVFAISPLAWTLIVSLQCVSQGVVMFLTQPRHRPVRLAALAMSANVFAALAITFGLSASTTAVCTYGSLAAMSALAAVNLALHRWR